MDIDLATPPDAGDALTVVSVAEMRRHMRLATTTRDDIIEQTIRDALAIVSGELRRTVTQSEWKLWLPTFPASGRIELPLPPVTSIESVGYLDATGAQQTMDASTYAALPGDWGGAVELLQGGTWPKTLPHPRAVWVTFAAGYDWVALTHPHCQQIKRAVKLLASHFYENSEATLIEGRLTNASKKVELGFDFITSRLRVPLRYD